MKEMKGESKTFISSEARESLGKIKPSEREKIFESLDELAESKIRRPIFGTGDKYHVETIGNHLVAYRRLNRSEAEAYGVKEGNFIGSIQPIERTRENYLMYGPREDDSSATLDEGPG
jgi:hypothetical protein